MPGKLAGLLAVAIYGSGHIRVYFCRSVSVSGQRLYHISSCFTMGNNAWLVLLLISRGLRGDFVALP